MSVIVMALLAWAKRRVAGTLGSSALTAAAPGRAGGGARGRRVCRLRRSSRA
jgi:hypothetical protein